MSKFYVDIASAVPLHRTPGANITLQNNDAAADVYYDEDGPDLLNASAPNATPTGNKLAKAGGQVQFYPFPGTIWLRADGAVASAPVAIEVSGGNQQPGKGGGWLKGGV